MWRIPEKTVNNGVRTAVQKECATILTPTQRPVVQQVTTCTRAFPTLVLQVTSLGKESSTDLSCFFFAFSVHCVKRLKGGMTRMSTHIEVYATCTNSYCVRSMANDHDVYSHRTN